MWGAGSSIKPGRSREWTRCTSGTRLGATRSATDGPAPASNWRPRKEQEGPRSIFHSRDDMLIPSPPRFPLHMAVGFVLISAAPGKEHEVYNTLLKVSEIVELHPLFGEYDLIAKLEAADFDTLGHVIVNKIRSIEGVVDTKTLTGTKF